MLPPLFLLEESLVAECIKAVVVNTQGIAHVHKMAGTCKMFSRLM